MNRLHLNTLIHLVLGIVLGASFAACGHVDAEETLKVAESELRLGNIDQAVNSCNLLTDTTETNLSSTQLCRVAIMYAKISEISENEDYMASATECFDRAIDMEEQRDSLDNYIASLDVEDQSYVRVIREVAHALNNPIDYLQNADDEEDDASIYAGKTADVVSADSTKVHV